MNSEVIFTMEFRPRYTTLVLFGQFSVWLLLLRVFFFSVDFVAIVFAISARHEPRQNFDIVVIGQSRISTFHSFTLRNSMLICVHCVIFYRLSKKLKRNQIKRQIKTVSEDSVRFFILCEYLRLSNKISHWNGQIAARLFAHHEHNAKKNHFPYYDELLHFSDLFYQ